MLSKACEYGIKASIFIVKQSLQGKRANVNEISEEIGSPIAFTAKILQKLVKAKLIFSIKGVNGGFDIEEKKSDTLNVLNIIIAIDGDGLVNACILGLNNCSSINPCPMHFEYSKLRTNLVKSFGDTLIKDLATALNNSNRFLKN